MIVNRYWKPTGAIAASLCFAVFAAVALLELISNQPAQRPLWAALVALFVLLAVRGARSATVIQYEDRVRIRLLTWTYTFPRERVRLFRTQRGVVGLYPRDYLIVELVGSKHYVMRGINGAANSDAPGGIRQICNSLNAGWNLAN